MLRHISLVVLLCIIGRVTGHLQWQQQRGGDIWRPQGSLMNGRDMFGMPLFPLSLSGMQSWDGQRMTSPNDKFQQQSWGNTNMWGNGGQFNRRNNNNNFNSNMVYNGQSGNMNDPWAAYTSFTSGTNTRTNTNTVSSNGAFSSNDPWNTFAKAGNGPLSTVNNNLNTNGMNGQMNTFNNQNLVANGQVNGVIGTPSNGPFVAAPNNFNSQFNQGIPSNGFQGNRFSS